MGRVQGFKSPQQVRVGNRPPPTLFERLPVLNEDSPCNVSGNSPEHPRERSETPGPTYPNPSRLPDETRLPPPGSFRSGLYRLARAVLINQGPSSGQRPPQTRRSRRSIPPQTATPNRRPPRKKAFQPLDPPRAYLQGDHAGARAPSPSQCIG